MAKTNRAPSSRWPAHFSRRPLPPWPLIGTSGGARACPAHRMGTVPWPSRQHPSSRRAVDTNAAQSLELGAFRRMGSCGSARVNLSSGEHGCPWWNGSRSAADISSVAGTCCPNGGCIAKWASRSTAMFAGATSKTLFVAVSSPDDEPRLSTRRLISRRLVVRRLP